MPLGVNRLFLWAAVALSAIAGLAAAGPASARPIPLSAGTCTGGADTAEAAFAIAHAALDCGVGRFNRRDRFVRGHVDLTKVGPLPPGRLIWQTDPASFDSMLIRLDYADGVQRLIDVDAGMAVRNWSANGNFWVPIQQGPAALEAMDVLVERPQSDGVLNRMTIASYGEASSSNYSRVLAYVLICGILLVPIIYDLFFYRVLRRRFMIWHLGMTVGTLLYVLFDSGLVLLIVPEMTSIVRYGMIYVAMSITILGTARFSALILEEGTLSIGLERALKWACVANLVIAVLILFDTEALRIRVADAYFLSVLPLIALTVAMLVVSLMRGSRAAVFLTIAYSGLIATGLTQVLASLRFFALPHLVSDAMYVALVILVVGTSAGVGDRFLVIKAERDRARLTAKRLGAMANSDVLTGLLNRRAFDQFRRLARGQMLLIADLDRFKAINDSYGHQRGDAVLCHAARVIEDVVASHCDGQVYRLGGEEFAVVCPAVDEDDGLLLAEAIRHAVAAPTDAYDMPAITISIGGVLGIGQLMHVAFSDADEALYRAKKGGRNRCELAGTDPI